MNISGRFQTLLYGNKHGRYIVPGDRGAKNWNIWKFAIRNFLRGDVYEVCVGDIVKPENLISGIIAEQQAACQTKLRIWDKANCAAC